MGRGTEVRAREGELLMGRSRVGRMGVLTLVSLGRKWERGKRIGS